MHAWYNESMRARIARPHRRRPARGASSGDPRARADAERRRRRAAQVLDPPVQGRAEKTSEVARARSAARAGVSPATTGGRTAPIANRYPLWETCCARPRRGGAVVRGRRHRRALPQPDRRAHPARCDARDDTADGPRQGGQASGDAGRAVGDRQRQADSRSRSVEKALGTSVSERESRNGRCARQSCRDTSGSASTRWSLAFEGVDAAGKGGAIRRVTGALDARQYVTVPIAAPTDEERAHPYLWRFWRKMPRRGGITHLRSLLVRARAGRARRATVSARRLDARVREINQFEEQLTARRGHRRQVLAADQQGRAAEALPCARAHAVQALQDHARGLAQPQEVGRLRDRGLRHGRSHQHRARAVDAGRSRGQALRAHQGPARRSCDRIEAALE